MLGLMMAAFLSPGGHVLLEDYPGLAKTLIANSFASALGMSFKRIQFTPDLLPGDITGGYVFNGGENRFMLRKGPIFTHVLLADEINRASPKTQSALLEAMQECQVTLEGETETLPLPFIVIATQNPIEHEGTFPLPEAQLDRFMVRLSIGYPGPEDEDEILRRRSERGTDGVDIRPVITPETFLAMGPASRACTFIPMSAATSWTSSRRHGSTGRWSSAPARARRSRSSSSRRRGPPSTAGSSSCRTISVLSSSRCSRIESSWTPRCGVRTSDRAVVEDVVRAVPVPVLPEESVHERSPSACWASAWSWPPSSREMALWH